MIGVCKICSKLFETTTEEAFSPDCTCVTCWRKAHGLPVGQRAALAVWYMDKAQELAEVAELLRSNEWLPAIGRKMLRDAQMEVSIYAKLAQQAQERYVAVQP